MTAATAPFHAVLGFPRHTALATWSQGSWEADYPVSNLGDDELAAVARSVDADADNTRFRATFSEPVLFRCGCFCRHNMTLDAVFDLRLYSDAAATTLIYSALDQDVWLPPYQTEDLEFEQENWFGGHYTAAERAGTPWYRPIVLPQYQVVQAIDVRIRDETNPAGYIDVGLFDMSLGTQFTANFDRGASDGHEARSEVLQIQGGGRRVLRQAEPRTWSGTFAWLRRGEYQARAYEMRRQHGTKIPLLWLPEPHDPTHWLREVYLAEFEELTGSERVTDLEHSWPVRLIERI